MAVATTRGPLPVGSIQWINDENAQVERHGEQEAEDFGFSARNELEWLNEHMADIFTKDQINVTEIFKTPGKLRGKTPRTARKRNPLETREPLTNIFSTNAESHPHPVFSFQDRNPERHAPSFKVAEDAAEMPAARTQKKNNTDSGYHGLSEDEMDVDQVQPPEETNNTSRDAPKSPSRLHVNSLGHSDDRSTTERSFHSAREEITKTNILDNVPQDVDAANTARPRQETSTKSQSEPMATDTEAMDQELEEDLVDESRTPSQGSSPARPLVRKSSLTFAALPAREPLTTKKSLGARPSRTSHLDQSNFLGRFTGGKSLGGAKQSDPVEGERDDAPLNMGLGDIPTLVRKESDTDAKTKLHNKSSTQRLHERIHLLGKSQTNRPTKSIPAAASVQQPSYPNLPDTDNQSQKMHKAADKSSTAVQEAKDEDEDDWIQPPKSVAVPLARPLLPKSISADVMEGIRGKQTISDPVEAQRRERSASRAESPRPYVGKLDGLRIASDSRAASPGIYSAYDGVKTFDDVETLQAAHGHRFGASTTPMGSPSSKRYVDGPLSASKSKLQSIMKTAKGLFSSSAGVSAQAKMGMLSPTEEPSQQPSVGEPLSSHAVSREKISDVRKTRSSTEKEERKRQYESSEQEVAQKQHGRVHQPENRKAPTEEVKAPVRPVNTAHPPAKATRQSPRKTQNQDTSEALIQAEPTSQSMAPPAIQPQGRSSQIQRPKDPRRPTKPAKDGPKPKPQPVAIRVGTLSTQRIPLNNATLSSSLQESLPPPQAKQSVVTKKPSLQPSASNSSLKSSVNATAKPKALIAAERKREQDEKEAQRKLEQKREIERRRAAQQEENKRQEQIHRQEVEKQRERERSAAAEDPRKIEQRRAIEKRRGELKKDQQRPAANHAPSTTRPELGGARPPSRQQNVPEHSRPINNHHGPNHLKAPIKRVFDPEIDDLPARPRPQGGASYQQNDSKRRKTDDDEGEDFPMRPTHAPPVRQSAIRKDGPKPSIFTSNYTTAPPPAPHHQNAPSLLKSTTQNQAYQQHAHTNQISRPGNHPDIKQYINGKIPFADHPNPPSQQQPQSQPFKTPHASKLAHPQTAAKSSPQYQNGENIHLDDIPTDSEDSSSSPDTSSKPKGGANLPEWAQSPNLRNLLMNQEEGLDADAVFGPVQSPHMEEMFRERHHRFRARTSSANWGGADRLTEEEIRRDVEARQRLRREGGWSFGQAM